MPEYAQLALIQFPRFVSLDRLVDAQILVVAGQNLGGAAVGVVKEDEVLQQIEKGFLFADAPEHGFQRHVALLLLLQTLPLVKEFVLAAERAHLGFYAVGKDEESVVVEQMRDGIQIVGVVVGIGVLHIHRGLFQLHKQQRNAIDKAHDVGAAVVEIAADFQLLDGQKMIAFRVLKVNQRRTLFLGFPTGTLYRDGNPVPDEIVFFLVDLHEGSRGKVALQLAHGLLYLACREPRIQPRERLLHIPGQQDFMITPAAKRAAFPQTLGVVGKDDLPAQLPLQQVPGAFLHEDVFGVVVAHGITFQFCDFSLV